jgi:hypothetical protein
MFLLVQKYPDCQSIINKLEEKPISDDNVSLYGEMSEKYIGKHRCTLKVGEYIIPILKMIDSRIRRPDSCLDCTYSKPFGFASSTQATQNDQYVGYDQRTAKFATINVQRTAKNIASNN